MNAHHSITEANTTIKALGPQSPVIAITSDSCASVAIAGVAWSLAGDALAAGRSIAIADFDFVAPQLHRYLARDQEPGVASVMAGVTQLADVIDFRLAPTGRFISLTAGKDALRRATAFFALSGPSLVSGLVDYAETVLLVAGPLTSPIARQVVGAADAAVMVVEDERHLTWPKGRPPEMRDNYPPVVAWVASEDAPPPGAAPSGGGPVIDLREMVEAPMVLREDPGDLVAGANADADHPVDQGGRGDLVADDEPEGDPASLWGALKPKRADKEPDEPRESSRRRRRLFRRRSRSTRYLD